MAANNHLASAETSELLSSSASDDEVVSVNFVSISDNVVRYKSRRSFPHEMEPGMNDVKSSSAAHSTMALRAGPRFLLFTEGDVQVCRISPKSSVSKVLRSQCLRHWENRHLILGSSDMSFHVQFGCVEQRIPYRAIEQIEAIAHWDATGHKFCIRIVICDCLLLIQTSTVSFRDQLLHSIRWKSCISKFWHTFQRATRCRAFIVYDYKEMIDLAVSSPILDDSILEFPLDVLAIVLDEAGMAVDMQSIEEMFTAISPLLEVCTPTKHLFDFFSKYCRHQDVGQFVINVFTPVIYKILKHNLDIGRQAKRRIFVQEYIEALRSQKHGGSSVWNFVKHMHGRSSHCPHLRILPNMVSVCLAMIHGYYEDRENGSLSSFSGANRLENLHILEEKLVTYLTIMQILCEYPDWLPHMASLLQPVPFPLVALTDDLFLINFRRILTSVADDDRCEIHSTVLGVREERDGWFDHFCPGSGIAGKDGGLLYGIMLRRLIGCCCRRKQFLQSKLKMLSAWCLLAERRHPASIEILIALLEYEICDEDVRSKQQMIDALQTTDHGQTAYFDFCQRKARLLEIQQKSGPIQLTLPSKSTDSDVSKLINSGSFGNLESLTLAFTNVTSACAQELIKLPSLKQLNLWSTQFSDAGLELLSEHMHQLKVLNLCETPVTDKGLRCLTALKSLRKLNLNSTQLSALTFEKLKKNLPLLEEYDIRYTDAW